MTASAKLYILQQIDTKLDRNEDRLVELAKAIGDDSVVCVANAAFEQAVVESKAVRREHQSIQDEIDAVTQKQVAGQERLYSGTVTNPKELQDLQDESGALARRIAALEERQLEAMIAQDDAESTEASALEALEIVRTDWKMEQAGLSEENDERLADRLRLKDERDAALIGVSVTAKQSYDAVRRQKRGVAVALLSDNICTACGMAPSAARIQQARSSSEPVKCGNCARIIYVK